MIEHIPENFDIYFKESINTETWFLDEEKSTEDKLIYIGYDANLCPMPSYRSFLGYNDTADAIRVRTAHNRIGDFEGEIWLDDVKIKDAGETRELMKKLMLCPPVSRITHEKDCFTEN